LKCFCFWWLLFKWGMMYGTACRNYWSRLNSSLHLSAAHQWNVNGFFTLLDS
jgi:hypothetical protein